MVRRAGWFVSDSAALSKGEKGAQLSNIEITNITNFCFNETEATFELWSGSKINCMCNSFNLNFTSDQPGKYQIHIWR